MVASCDGAPAMTDHRPASVGVVGASWRAQYSLRIASRLPERFVIRQVLARTDSSIELVSNRWGVDATTDAARFLREGPYDYVVIATPREVAPELIRWLVSADVPVLVETPPAGDLPALVDLYDKVAGASIQVAEQYPFQPQHAARLKVAGSGILGSVTSARMSIAHGYHGVRMLRSALGVGFDPVTIRAQTVTERLVSARGRDDWNDEFVDVDDLRTMATLRFGDGPSERFGQLDFMTEQYFSPIRSRHLSIRGSRGEVVDDLVSHLSTPGGAIHESLRRETTGMDGDLEGSFLRRIWLGRDVCFENGFVPARLSDDELAVAEVMSRMVEYVASGTEFSGLADASQDHYLALLVDQAAETGGVVMSSTMPWTSARSLVERRV
jgi:predicted dehydrogenase